MTGDTTATAPAPDASRYLIALGSNVPHPRHGAPRRVLRAALAALDAPDCRVIAIARVIDSAPIGPSRRRYANGAALVQTTLAPLMLLDRLQAIEAAFGRVRRGARWRARTLDLDIVLWSGGAWHDRRLTIPHPEYRRRHFVLAPAAQIAPSWRDPIDGTNVKHAHARLTRRAALPKAPVTARQVPGP
ncbi:2-amino-4-hydroxy-6-hydroxymethyldihydropteridine diphosphokinase [Novosphingobium sp.]|uniref:2-amino-4-hydroxy-6- hydroxymethyldihydropteridine diphosphokinase n=1 Tax=Novosphingobium sp. TaxID=1874826 RepID=UPI00333E4C82